MSLKKKKDMWKCQPLLTIEVLLAQRDKPQQDKLGMAFIFLLEENKQFGLIKERD